MRVSYDEMYSQLKRVLEKYGITGQDAELSAKLYTDASLDGIYTHGLNRFPKFIKTIADGHVDPKARATKVESFGVLERYDGNNGPGNLNAWIAMNRAIELAKSNTIGVVAIRNNNHWMRAGNYGLLAAKNDCIGILWTNTIPNMAPWGGKEDKIGNNQIVFAIPHGDTPILVDVAMSLFSYGKLEKLKRAGEQTPVDAGYDIDGNITRDPAAVIKTHQVFPIGYWKGSAMTLALDIIAAITSGGNLTRQIGTYPIETHVSQFFMAIDIYTLKDRDEIMKQVEISLEELKACEPMDSSKPVHFPGEGMQAVRKDNLENGIPVDEGIWQQVLAL